MVDCVNLPPKESHQKTRRLSPWCLTRSPSSSKPTNHEKHSRTDATTQVLGTTQTNAFRGPPHFRQRTASCKARGSGRMIQRPVPIGGSDVYSVLFAIYFTYRKSIFRMRHIYLFNTSVYASPRRMKCRTPDRTNNEQRTED